MLRARLLPVLCSRQRRLSSIRPLQSSEIRERFLKFFESEHQHKRLSASSLLPASDPTLLFTNAGMVQFKDIFTGAAVPSVPRAVTAQRCLRAGGKHNDLDNVGHTARHHTLFEMLGNFSFADYGAETAIAAAWKFVTNEQVGLGIPQNKLRVSVLQGDVATAALWRKLTNSAVEVVECSAKDNFWSMGDGPGPCGPCTEIFFDQGKEVDGDRWLELWNLVLMQNQRDTAGKLHVLPKTSIDTGMGLERVAAVLQGQPTNFDADVFQPLIDATFDILKVSGTVRGVGISSPKHQLTDAQRAAFKVIVDHTRASAALIADGVLPSAVGRGYVLRRIIRRALRYATTLGATRPVLCELVPALVSSQSVTLPNLSSRAQVIEATLRAEEEAFLSTLKRGERILNEALQKSSGQLPASVVHELYDRFGFPVDLTALIAQERGVSFDQSAVEALIEERRAASRAAWTGSGDTAMPVAVRAWSQPAQHMPDAFPRVSFATAFANPNHQKQFSATEQSVVQVSFDKLTQAEKKWTVAAKLTDVVRADKPADDTKAASVWINIDANPFYAQGGGQVGDRGFLQIVAPGHVADGARFAVLDTQKAGNGIALLMSDTSTSVNESDIHETFATLQPLIGKATVLAIVDGQRRHATAVHHSATHLLQAALRQVLGVHITQAGSRVAPEHLRFDYTHSNAVTPAELAAVEAAVNNMCLSAIASNIQQTSHTDAVNRLKATALFSEKYGDTVRVVSFAPSNPEDLSSVELCGGTHVDNTEACFPFVIRSEGSIGAGARRIEAVAGRAGAEATLQHSRSLKKVADLLTVPVREVETRVVRLLERPSAGRPVPASTAQPVDAAAASTSQQTTLPSCNVRVSVHVLDSATVLEHRTAADKNEKADKLEKAERKFAGRQLQTALRAAMDKQTDKVPVHIAVCDRHVAILVAPDAGDSVHALQMLNVLLNGAGSGGGKADNAQGAWNASSSFQQPQLDALFETLHNADRAGSLRAPKL